MLRQWAPVLVIPLMLALPGSEAHAWGKKDKAVHDKGMMMPDLEAVLGNAYEVPPELSDRAVPGAVLRVTQRGWQPVLSGCVAGTPDKSAMTDMSMQNSLAGGVSVRADGVGAGASASSTQELAFIAPHILGFEEAVFAPSADCMTRLKDIHTRRGLDGVVLVQESLVAKIKGSDSDKRNVGGRVPVVGGARVMAASHREHRSDVYVVVGVRTVDLLSLPSFAADLASASDLVARVEVSQRHTSVLMDAVRASVHQGTAGKASLITRENMATLLRDRNMESKKVKGIDAVETGRKMAAAYVVTGAITEMDGALMCKLEIYNTKHGTLVATTSFQGRNVAALVAQVPPVMSMQMRQVRQDISRAEQSRRRARSMPKIAVLELQTR